MRTSKSELWSLFAYKYNKALVHDSQNCVCVRHKQEGRKIVESVMPLKFIASVIVILDKYVLNPHKRLHCFVGISKNRVKHKSFFFKAAAM